MAGPRANRKVFIERERAGGERKEGEKIMGICLDSLNRKSPFCGSSGKKGGFSVGILGGNATRSAPQCRFVTASLFGQVEERK